VPSAGTQQAVEVEVAIAASPDTVFDFFTDPDKMIQWMGRSADLDPTPGGDFRCDINGRDIASGTYTELDRPNRVVFSWGWEGPDSLTPAGSSTVEVTLIEVGDATRVRLVHSGLPSEESRANHAHGWNHYCERLALRAAGTDPGPDPWATPEGADKEFD
jgi:uncharacterized protein YndB with AHSA1/START domain